MKTVTLFCTAIGLQAAGAVSGPGAARALAETLSKLQRVAFEDPATGDALLRSLKAQSPSQGKLSLVALPDYPFAEQSAFQAHSPDVIHINFDVPRAGSSFVQSETAAKDSDPIGSLMRNYRQIGEIVGNFQNSQALSDSDIRNMVDQANQDDARHAGAACPECSEFRSGETTVSGTKPVLEVRLAAPKVAPWDSFISGLVHQREQMESKYMTMFRELFDQQFSKKKLERGISLLQKSGADSVRVNVGKMQQIAPDVISMVNESEAQRNQQEAMMLKSAIAFLKSQQGSHTFLGVSDIDANFDVKVGQGSAPFVRFYDAVRNMQMLRRASEQRIRSRIVSMMSQFFGGSRQNM